MDNFRRKLEQFLQGRYGIDELNKCLFVLYIVFFLLNILTRDSLFYVLGLMVIVYLFFRCFSKNYAARQRENAKILKYTDKINKKYRLYMRMWNDRHTHVYRKCPHCKTMIRLPKVKGKHTTTCPKCHKDFQVKV